MSRLQHLGLLLLLFLTACGGGNKAWDGYSPQNPAEELGEATCACLVTVLEAMDVDVDGMLAVDVDKFVSDRVHMQPSEVREKYPFMKVLADPNGALDTKMRATPCFQDILAQSKADPELGKNSKEPYLTHCKLSVFLK